MTIIADLELQVEHWRQRAEAAEAVVYGRDGALAVRPLSLQQTRIMRAIAFRDISADALLRLLSGEYPGTSKSSLRAQLTLIRRKLPEGIAPVRGGAHRAPCTVPDRAALRAFLGLTAPANPTNGGQTGLYHGPIYPSADHACGRSHAAVAGLVTSC